MIIASAIKLKDGSVFTGKRHSDCYRNFRDILMTSSNNWTEDILKSSV